jgi:hypothetical protein
MQATVAATPTTRCTCLAIEMSLQVTATLSGGGKEGEVYIEGCIAHRIISRRYSVSFTALHCILSEVETHCHAERLSIDALFSD